MSAMSPDAFASSLVAVVPEKIVPKLSEVYFDAATQLFEAMVLGCDGHIDTGYMRAGAQATAEGQSPQSIGERNPHGNYTSVSVDSGPAMAAAAKSLTPLTMGFVAEYAIYEEDHGHMVKNARGQWSQIVERAIQNAGGG